MTREQFINEIAKYIQKYAPQYEIKVCSPIIAQAILESGGGTSELAMNAHNYFGLKYKTGRCPSASGVYYKIGSEQNPDGSYVSSAMQWFKFNCMEDGVVGYFDFINHSRYANLKGITDPKKYLELIKMDGYATSLNYVDNVYKVIQNYNLTKYDTKIKEETTMKKPVVIALSAGHGLYTAGKRCMKALDPNETREWFLNDRIADKVEQKLGAYNCKVIRVNDTTGKTDTALSTRTTISNTANADIYLAIHHNAGVNGGSGGGTVVFYYPTGNNKDIATKLYNHIISYTGLKGNRSKAIASTTSLYEVRKPKAKALLIENGFMDSRTDVPIILTEEHAEKTAIGIVDFFIEYFGLIKNGATVTPTTPASSTTLYRVRKSWDKPSTQVGAFSSFEKAKAACKSGYYVFDENGNILYPEVNNISSTYTHKDFVKEVQAAIGAKVDGIAGNETLSKTVTVSKTKNRKHAVVKPIQKYLNSQGYNAGNADGVAGVKFDTALKAFQKANGCVADGEATAQKSTWKKLLKL